MWPVDGRCNKQSGGKLAVGGYGQLAVAGLLFVPEGPSRQHVHATRHAASLVAHLPAPSTCTGNLPGVIPRRGRSSRAPVDPIQRPNSVWSQPKGGGGGGGGRPAWWWWWLSSRLSSIRLASSTSRPNLHPPPSTSTSSSAPPPLPLPLPLLSSPLLSPSPRPLPNSRGSIVLGVRLSTLTPLPSLWSRLKGPLVLGQASCLSSLPPVALDRRSRGSKRRRRRRLERLQAVSGYSFG